MNQLVTKTEEQIASQALATINPIQYVEAVYAPFLTRVDRAIQRIKDVKYDIKTTIGMNEAKEFRALFRDIRIEADKERKARKEPLLIIGKLLESANTKIEESVATYEDRFDFEIKAEEKRKEDIKVEALRLEEIRKAELQAKIDEIKNLPIKVLNYTSSEVLFLRNELSVIISNEQNFQERYVEVEIIIEQTLQLLNNMFESKKLQEEQAITRQQEEAQRQKDEAEANRVNAIKAKIQDIKNNIVIGAECETVASLFYLLTKVGNINIFEEEYQEFTNEAKVAKSIVIGALNRQYDAVEAAQKAVEAKRIADETTVNLNKKVADAQVARESVSETKVDLDKFKDDKTEVNLQEVVVDHQPEIAAFFKTRDFTKAKENEYRAVLVEFLKHCALNHD